MHRQERISKQNGIITGNIENKGDLSNPIAKFLVHQFDETLFDFLESTNPKSIHEVGCGEGRLIKKIHDHYDISLKGTDLSHDLINNLKKSYSNEIILESKSIYDLDEDEDFADVIVCCEVLEHLEYPGKAIEALKRINARYYILSVPREPIWRILNIIRGKYLSDIGNTPGHLNHWSKKEFLDFLEDSGFEIDEYKNPLPWTMVKGRFNKPVVPDN